MNEYIFPLLVLGGFGAGFINTLAGGGSMLTLPLLILLGLPADVANGTNRIAVLAQNVTAVLGFHSKGVRPWKSGVRLFVPTCLGAAAGAGIAVQIDPDLLETIFGAVLFVLCGAVFLKPNRLLKGRDREIAPGVLSIKTFLFFFGVGLWGGFAQVGVGFLFLGALVTCSRLDLVYANAVKIFVILIFTVFSFVIFLLSGQVEIVAGLVLAVGNASGAWTASVMSVKKGSGWVRIFLIVAALLASLKLLGVFDFAWDLLTGW